jgi:hypothetical protein
MKQALHPPMKAAAIIIIYLVCEGLISRKDMANAEPEGLFFAMQNAISACFHNAMRYFVVADFSSKILNILQKHIAVHSGLDEN